MKRYIMVCFSVLTLLSGSALTVYGKTFVDMNQVSWQGAKPYIYEAVELGIMNGDGKSQKFRPNAPVTYCEVMQVAYTVLKKTNTLCSYADAEGDKRKWNSILEICHIPQWARESVAYGLEHGVLSVTDVSHFMKGNQQQYASRESTAVIFGKAMAILYALDEDASISYYYDRGNIARTSVPYIDLLKQTGVMKGRSEHMFYPTQQLNRAELAVLGCNAYSAMTLELVWDEDDYIQWMIDEGLMEWLAPPIEEDMKNTITEYPEENRYEENETEENLVVKPSQEQGNQEETWKRPNTSDDTWKDTEDDRGTSDNDWKDTEDDDWNTSDTDWKDTEDDRDTSDNNWKDTEDDDWNTSDTDWKDTEDDRGTSDNDWKDTEDDKDISDTEEDRDISDTETNDYEIRYEGDDNSYVVTL